jgi:prolyl-tRNA synthetase
VQAGTSHYLGTNFAAAFDIKYLDRDNQQQLVHTTSWGVSTRLIGALIMVHGDDKGLILPPKVAPTQAMLIPIGPPAKREPVLNKANEILIKLKQAGIRIRMDDRAEMTPGWKFNEYEMRGIPIRIEMGPRDLEQGQAVLVSRVSGAKRIVALESIVADVTQMLHDVHEELYQRAYAFLTEHLRSVDTLAELQQNDDKLRGFVLAGWCGKRECEAKVKEETGATSRNIPFHAQESKSFCLVCHSPARHTVAFARSY